MMRRSLFTLLTLACVLMAPALAAPANAAAKQVRTTPGPGFHWTLAATAEGYRLPEQAAPAEREAMLETQRWLASESVRGVEATTLRVELSPAELAEISGPTRDATKRFLVGASKDVGVGIDFSSLRPAMIRSRAQGLTFGAIRGTRTGGYVWSAAIDAPGASAVRLHLTNFDLPRGAELWVYNDRGQAHGPYVSRGPLGTGEVWTQAIFGDRVHLQLRQNGSMSRNALAATRFVIADVGYMGPRFEIAKDDAVRYDISIGKLNAAGYCPDNANCVVGACETSTDGAVSMAEDAVAHMLFASGRYYYICTGGLLADEAQSGTPLFLTANHCISKGREANSLETYFHYDDPLCNCPAPPYRNYTTLGATILAANRSSDYTLMELSSTPSGVAFMGWDATDIAFADGTQLYRISHPSGVPQAYSEHSVDTSYGTCSSWPRGGWIYSHDDFGATEGGSSGSPVLNADGKVVGQLSGACGTNVNDNCDPSSNATVDGALAAYYDDVAQILGDGGGSCTPATEVCDGVDNDCDGQIDEGGVCDPGMCFPKGDSCTANSECCSNKCKGKSGSKTCK